MDQAMALRREIIDVAAMAGEWTSEVRARIILADMLWQTKPIEVAAAHIQDLARMVRARPTTAGETAIVMANMVGIFAEMGQVEEAMHAAREAWPFMRRSKQLFLEETVYLFWRSGLLKPAALLLGASDAEVARHGAPRQPNEQRLMTAARPALAITLGATEFTACLAAGASMREGEIHALIAENLADGSQPA